MKTTFTSSAALALALTATAPLTALAASFNEPSSGYGTIKYGESFTLKFTGDGSPVKIAIAAGPSNDVKEVTSLTNGFKTISSDSLTTSISKGSLPTGKYSFTITTEKAPINYSSSFCVESCTSAPKAEESKVESKIATATSSAKKEYEKVKQDQKGYYSAEGNSTTPATATGTGVSATGTGSSQGGSGVTPFTGAAAKVGAGVAGVVCVAAGLVGGMMML